MAGRRKGPALRVAVVTLFPGMFEGPLTESIVGRAREKGRLALDFVNPRDFAPGRHRTVDDRPYGGGAGMVLMAEPIYQAIRKARRRGARVILLSPQGRRFTQAKARELASLGGFVLVCGHYEGMDERVREFADEELSLGDFVLTGGEIPAMAVVDAVARLLPGVLAKQDAAARESFSGAPGISTILSSPARPSGGDARSPRCSSPGITPGSRIGAGPRPSPRRDASVRIS